MYGRQSCSRAASIAERWESREPLTSLDQTSSQKVDQEPDGSAGAQSSFDRGASKEATRSKEPSTKRASSKEEPRRGHAIRRPSFVMRQPWQGVLIRLEPWPRRFVGESRRVNEARPRRSRPRRRRGRQFSLDTRAIHRSPGEMRCVLRRRRILLDEDTALTSGNFERQSLSIPGNNRDRRQLRGNPHRAKNATQ